MSIPRLFRGRTAVLAVVAATLPVLSGLSPARANTFILPHILEKSGSIAQTPFTFDTTLYLTYNGSLRGTDRGSARVDFYLYDDQTGELMRGVSNTICGPCTFELDAQHRKASVRLEDYIVSRGGGFDTEMKAGFGVLVVSGAQSNAVNCEVVTLNSHSNAQDISVFGFEPQGPLSTGSPQARRSFVIPHVLESSGKAAVESNAFDTTLYATYVGGLPGAPGGGGATVEVYLYDQSTGQAMIGGGGGEVCNPCTFALGTGGAGSGPRQRTIRVDDLITAAGGFGGATTKQGFAVVSVGGKDPAAVNLQGFVVNSHTSPFDLSVFGFEPQPARPNGGDTEQRSFVLPHVLERSGRITTEPYTFDTTLYATYTPGLGGLPDGKGATLSLYLYDDGGAPMHGSNGVPVCAPCTYELGAGGAGTAAPRKLSIRIDDLITSRGGGFDTASKLGFGLAVVGGADPDGVNLQGFVVNSHTSAFDTSVFGFDPQPIRAARLASSGSESPAKALVVPHVLETKGSVSSTPNVFDTTLYATYVGGLPGTVSSNGATLKLYLYDSETGLPLTGAIGEVCNPCAFDLAMDRPKLSLTVDDLIVERGGGFGNLTDKSAFGVVILDGDATDVKLQGFVVNAHTSPFDLSVFGFEPQPIMAARLAPSPIQITQGAGGIQIAVSTVIGAHYSLETRSGLTESTWEGVYSFDGDGSIQAVKLPPSQFVQQFYRVRGY